MKEKNLFSLLILIAIAFMAVQCTDHYVEESFELVEKSEKIMPVLKTTGSVQFLWKGGGQNNGKEMEELADNMLAFIDFNAHKEVPGQDPKGEVVFRILDKDSVLHREIRANVQNVFIDPVQSKAWLIASVYYDSKGLENDQCNDENGGCSHDDDGGCDHEDEEESSHDGGCTHDDGEECSDSEEGGCTHDDEGSCEGGGEGGSGSTHLSGKNSRIGQIMAVKVHDGGSPGAVYDGITWKWFSSTGTFIPAIENISQWPHLCKKTIMEGNLVVHE